MALESPSIRSWLMSAAKVSTKPDLLGNLVGKVDRLVIGGGMAGYLLSSVRHRGREKRDTAADTARAILEKAEDAERTIVLLVDTVTAGRPGCADDDG